MSFCYQCGKELHGEKYCTGCGTLNPEYREPAKPRKKICAVCGKELHDGKFCTECGTPNPYFVETAEAAPAQPRAAGAGRKEAPRTAGAAEPQGKTPREMPVQPKVYEAPREIPEQPETAGAGYYEAPQKAPGAAGDAAVQEKTTREEPVQPEPCDWDRYDGTVVVRGAEAWGDAPRETPEQPETSGSDRYDGTWGVRGAEAGGYHVRPAAGTDDNPSDRYRNDWNNGNGGTGMFNPSPAPAPAPAPVNPGQKPAAKGKKSGGKGGSAAIIILLALCVILIGVIIWILFFGGEQDSSGSAAESSTAASAETVETAEAQTAVSAAASPDTQNNQQTEAPQVTSGTPSEQSQTTAGNEAEAAATPTATPTATATPSPSPSPSPTPEVEVYDSTEGGIHRYSYILADCTWSEALQLAKQQGGYLARINSQEEFNYITGELTSQGYADHGYQFYVGGKRDWYSYDYYWVDEDGNTYGDIINDSSYWAYATWLSGEPSFMDGSNHENCMSIYYNSSTAYRWVINDVPDDVLAVVPYNSGYIGYIVEYDQ